MPQVRGLASALVRLRTSQASKCQCCRPSYALHRQVRFCTEPYSPPASDNLDRVYAHLTNYAVNKHNAAFQFNQ